MLLPNPIHSTLSLIVTLTSVAGIYALLEAHFLATVQIIVYAGAIVVLVLFVLMLLNAKVEEIERKPVGTIFLILFSAVVLFSILFPLLLEEFGQVPMAVSLGNGIEGGVAELGKVLYTKFVLPFEVASLLIMAALVGAVMIGRSRQRSVKQLHGNLDGALQSVREES